MTTTLPYSLPSGRKAVITVEAANLRGTVYATTSAMVEGVGRPILGGRTKPAGMPAWAVSCIGKLPLTPEMDAAVAAAEAEINAAYAASNAAIAEKMAALDKLTDSSRRLERAMAH
jgi:hypothetical protein